MRQKLRNHTGKLVLFFITIISFSLFPATLAWAPPLNYGDFGNVKVIDGTVSGDELSGDIEGAAGDEIILNGPLVIDNDIPASITQIKLKFKNKVNGRIRITRIDPPSGDSPPGAIGFFHIDLEGFSDADLDEVEIMFQVGNEYVNVHLYRLSGGNWALLDTSRVETGSDSSTYKALSPGFSDFAIVAQRGAVGRTRTGSLPYTSGAPLYVIAMLGMIFIVAGATIRITAAK